MKGCQECRLPAWRGMSVCPYAQRSRLPCCSPHQTRGHREHGPADKSSPNTPIECHPNWRVRFPNGPTQPSPAGRSLRPWIDSIVLHDPRRRRVDRSLPKRDVVEGQNKAAAPHARSRPRSRRHIDADDAARRSMPVWMRLCRGVWGLPREAAGGGRARDRSAGGRCAFLLRDDGGTRRRHTHRSVKSSHSKNDMGRARTQGGTGVWGCRGWAHF